MGELDGVWQSTYIYSGGQGRHRVRLEQNEGNVTVHSLPNEENSSLKMELELNGRILSGYWGELTSPTGEYKGQFFEGFVAFTIKNSTRVEGQWIGANKDDSRINSGPWILERIME